jgi:proteasome-associated ATPase
MDANEDQPVAAQNGQDVSDELTVAKQKLQEAEKKVASLESDKTTLGERNRNLANTLKEAREQLLALRAEVDRLGQPPSGYGVLLAVHEDDTVDVFQAGRKYRLACSPNVDVKSLKQGQTVRLNEALTVVEAVKFTRTGELCTLREVLDDRVEGEAFRAVVITHTDEEKIVWVAESMDQAKLKTGDTLLVDTKAEFAYERIPKSEAEELVLEEVPDISYADVGGLKSQLDQIRDAVELPFLYPELFKEYHLKAPKGVLLYGPPGCGKTLIAKAVANSLAKKMQARDGGKGGKAYFLNIKGPELLNKFVGETERHIREIFRRAREKASEGEPVIVFFDEMESMFRTRGSGISSDVESTIVPQLLSEIDGVEGLENVLVIGASNREDMIDPAVLRPGRLDVKIKVERPDAEAAVDIFSKYLTTDLPLHADELEEWGGDKDQCIKGMVEKAVYRMYAEVPENMFIQVTYASGDKEDMYFKDFSSGAMIENIVARAKKYAIKAVIEAGQSGIRFEYLLSSILDEFRENEDLPNTTNPDDWARISGKKGERIVYIRTWTKGNTKEGNKAIVDASPSHGQYL